MNKLRNIIIYMLLIIAITACDNEPERILFTGPDFVFIESSATVPVLENSTSNLKIPVKVSFEQAQDVTVNFTITATGAVAGIDYNLVTASPVTIPAGQYQTFIEIEPIDNDDFEPNERSFTVTITEVGNLDKQVRTSVKVVVVNDDCPAEIPKIVNWIGNLSAEDIGYGTVAATGEAGPDGSCGGVLVITGGDFIGSGGGDCRIIVKFTQDFEGSTTGTVEVTKGRIFVNDGLAAYHYEGTGTYDEDTGDLYIDYIFYDNVGEIWWTGTNYFKLIN